jgi:endonuclease YncB( thermonuclease family)
MKMPHYIRILILVALSLTICSRGSASALSGKVTGVVNGGSITLVSLNHPLKVRLVGIAAPEAGQPFADVARQHLADLTLNKYVVVRYSILEHDGYLAGRVLLETQDVGAQMIRDGVAWYDKSDQTQLGELERQLYIDSEQAARTERRGLWQDESPTAPWDFRKARLAQINPTAPTLARSKPYVRKGNQAGLSSDDLMGGLVKAGSPAGRPELKPVAPNSPPGEWVRFEPDDRQFSVLIPAGGIEENSPVIDSQARIVHIHTVVGEKDGTSYLVLWTKSSNDNATDASAAESVAKGFTDSFNRSLQSSGLDYVITAKPTGDVRLGGYAGKQYRISGGPVFATVRVLSKQIGDQREGFVLLVVSRVGSSGQEFLNSFRIRKTSSTP